jgi:hypothetical protein
MMASTLTLPNANGQRQSKAVESADAIEIHLEPLAPERLRIAIEAPNTLWESLKTDFRRLQAELGRRPSLVDIERRGRYPGRRYRMSFSTSTSAEVTA